MLLHYTDCGSGDPIVLLHGIVGSGRYWDKFKTYIVRKRVITVDLMGFGQSQMPKTVDYTYESHIQSIIETLDYLKVNQPITIVGHSMGALLALRLAVMHPEKVVKLVLIGMPIYTDAVSARKAITGSKLRNKLAFYGPTSHVLCTAWCRVLRPLSKRIAPYYLKHVPKTVAHDSVFHTWQSYSQSMNNVIENQQVAEDITELNIPVTLFYGNKDVPVALDKLDILHISKYIKIFILEGTHQIVYEHPSEIARSI
ncbi:hypothetical protein BH10PAT3_BH10PAT3_0610 [soil metagenome]